MPTHRCPIRAGAGGPIDEKWCVDYFTETLTAIPPHLPEHKIKRRNLRIYKNGDLSIYYVPFERVNGRGKIMLVGLTPGRHQMWVGCMAAAQVLRNGGSTAAALDAASLAGSFAGSMRTNLIQMLDEVGVANWLGFESTSSLWTSDASHLRAATSALLHAVFVADENYHGSPKIASVPVLTAFVDQVLAANLKMAPEVLIVPLGVQVTWAVQRLVDLDKVDGTRVLKGFPHPSGGNGHRKRQFEEHKHSLRRQVARWAAEAG